MDNKIFTLGKKTYKFNEEKFAIALIIKKIRNFHCSQSSVEKEEREDKTFYTIVNRIYINIDFVKNNEKKLLELGILELLE